MTLTSRIQTNQILTNDDEVCITRLSSILLALIKIANGEINYMLSLLRVIFLNHNFLTIWRSKCVNPWQSVVSSEFRWRNNASISLKQIYKEFIQCFHKFVCDFFTIFEFELVKKKTNFLLNIPNSCFTQFSSWKKIIKNIRTKIVYTEFETGEFVIKYQFQFWLSSFMKFMNSDQGCRSHHQKK